jgi:hypothetical protein
MQHASHSVGALAAALAKAQADLINPERSASATLPASMPGEPQRTFRYAPLSSGLDIIRKSLGRHEIAFLQRTDIDEGGLIRLITVLTHSSGEWISSDWPVCSVGETSAPHRLGAALTYARRYALFTLVGIAGEDDNDAPDVAPLSGGAHRDSMVIRQPNDQNGGTVALSKRSATQSTRERLSSEDSAEQRQQLEAELANVASAEELLRWAKRILPAKNSLDGQDAKLVEQAFLARLHSLQGPQFDEHEAELSPAFERAHNGDTTLAIPKTPIRRDKKHLRFVASQPCLICGRTPSDAHHLRFAQPRALGRKVSDEFTVPLCRVHHGHLHNAGDERGWWTDLNIDPAPIAERLWNETR